LDKDLKDVVCAEMFANELYKMKTHEISTSVGFVKRYTEAMCREMKVMQGQLAQLVRAKTRQDASEKKAENEEGDDDTERKVKLRVSTSSSSCSFSEKALAPNKEFTRKGLMKRKKSLAASSIDRQCSSESGEGSLSSLVGQVGKTWNNLATSIGQLPNQFLSNSTEADPTIGSASDPDKRQVGTVELDGTDENAGKGRKSMLPSLGLTDIGEDECHYDEILARDSGRSVQ